VRPLPDMLPAGFRAIVRKALAVRPEHRYPSAQAFAADLNAFLENKPTVAESEPVIVEEDDEATRRVGMAVPAEVSDDATRRTVPGATPFPAPPSPAKAVPFRAAKAPKKPLTPRQRQIRFFTVLGLGMLFGLLVFNEVTVWRSGSELAREVESERLKDMDLAWQRMETLQKTSFVPFVLSGPRNSILGRLVSTGDAVVNEYRRADNPSVSENDWVRAQSAFAKVLQIDPRNAAIRGRMYLCEAHLLRIRGVSRGNSKMLNEARARFEQAAELMPRSPDPYIGLARLYGSLRDVEKLEDALEAAEKRGHDTGRRERGQIADAYRDRGERLMKDAVRAAGLPEEGDLLSRSEKDLHRAEELYREILPYGNSTASLRRVLENLDVVRSRRDAMKDSIWPWR
jgi:tetratricopeptide (TPR) repeat protein